MARHINLKNMMVLIFLFYYVSGIIGLNLYYELDLDDNKEEVPKRVFDSVRSSLEILGLYGRWAFFTSPSKEEYYFLIRGHASGGGSVDHVPPGSENVAFKIQNDKKRKFHYGIGHGHSEIRTAYLKSFCAKFEEEHARKFKRVILYQNKRQIPDITSPERTEFENAGKWSVEC